MFTEAVEYLEASLYSESERSWLTVTTHSPPFQDLYEKMRATYPPNAWIIGAVYRDACMLSVGVLLVCVPSLDGAGRQQYVEAPSRKPAAQLQTSLAGPKPVFLNPPNA